MDVTVKFFATYREATGLRETIVSLPTGATVEDLLSRIFEAHPNLSGERGAMLLAVNREFADAGDELHPGDEVAVLPPVSGGSGLIRIQNVRAGAVVLFLGTVRADPGIVALDYEAYEEMAVAKMEALRAAAKAKFGITEMAVVHRTGRLALGETSIAVACSAPHRQDAFRACEWAMDELKQIVPIWKTERR